MPERTFMMPIIPESVPFVPPPEGGLAGWNSLLAIGVSVLVGVAVFMVVLAVGQLYDFLKGK